jgi:hypothetical protein
MADHGQMKTKPGMDEKQQGQMPKRPMSDVVGQRHGVVGNDIPDESKERHTEIAVEAGEKLSRQQAKH